MSTYPLLTHQRQVHLDFHTSPLIPDVAAEFDPREFARTFRKARVNSVTIFAKCHHGMSYYPTKAGTMHPALQGRDLLGEMIEALHREGIRAPLYTSVGFDEHAAMQFPDWRALRTDGTCSRVPGPGGWWFLNFLHPDYLDYIEAHLRELFADYEVDGLFFDILLFMADSCWSETSRKFRSKHGLLGSDLATQTRFESAAQLAFARRFSRLIRGLKKEATIFYNSANPLFLDSTTGVRPRQAFQTHWELESLPSGSWGYFHFPRLARAMGNWGQPWLGMTGRFQRSWGDFGGLKPQPALEYECFRSQALGGANSIGDQLPPRGRSEASVYDLIGAVFAQCEEAEPFYRGSTACPQVGIFPADGGGAQADVSLEGAVQMCEEAHYDAIVLTDESSLDGLEVLIFPDEVTVTPRLADKLKAYAAAGGKIIFSGNSLFDADGGCQWPGAKLRRLGVEETVPTYWRTEESFDAGLSRGERVVYQAGQKVVPGEREQILAQRVLPYFARTELTFCSHFQAPPRARADQHPAIVGGKNFVYFADPIFREYRQAGNIATRDAWKVALRNLIGGPAFGEGLPSTVLCVPRRRGKDLLVTLLHYIPVRKALDIDMIEERSSFAGEVLRLRTEAQTARVFGSETALERTEDGGFLLPAAKGRLMIEVPGYFAARPTKVQKGAPKQRS